MSKTEDSIHEPRGLPESEADSSFAEHVAESCRYLSTILLSKVGDELRDAVRTELLALQSQINGPRRSTTPAISAPRFSTKGQINFATNPVRSARNPLAPPIRLHEEGESGSEFRVTLGLPYQGPRNFLHGGYVAVLLDEVLWHAVHHAHSANSFTRELNVSYERPVPLFTEVRIVGRIARIDGRKTFAEGEIMVQDQVCARAEGFWISPRSKSPTP